MADTLDTVDAGRSTPTDLNAIIEDISREMAEQTRLDYHPELLEKELQRAARYIKEARALVITAGTGLGVESGLPDFRDVNTFQKSYPQLQDTGIDLSTISDPIIMTENPKLVWGFFAHHFNLYRDAKPHWSLDLLREWSESMREGYYVYTNTVDGHFQKAGFEADRIVECNGNIFRLQYAEKSVSGEVWDAPKDMTLEVEQTTLQLKSPLPMATPTGKQPYLLRPNVCMFNDYQWVGDAADEQKRNFYAFHQKIVGDLDVPFVVIEIGAGLAEQSIRYASESLVTHNKGILIRINPVEADVPDGVKRHVSLPMKVSRAIKQINELLLKQ